MATPAQKKTAEVVLTLRLSSQAREALARRAEETGKDEATLVGEAVEEKLAPSGAAPGGRTADQWEAEFKAWVASHRPVPHFVDDSRESIYAGRGE